MILSLWPCWAIQFIATCQICEIVFFLFRDFCSSKLSWQITHVSQLLTPCAGNQIRENVFCSKRDCTVYTLYCLKRDCTVYTLYCSKRDCTVYTLFVKTLYLKSAINNQQQFFLLWNPGPFQVLKILLLNQQMRKCQLWSHATQTERIKCLRVMF